jgi:hypothetical protein
MVWGETTDFWFTPNSLASLTPGRRHYWGKMFNKQYSMFNSQYITWAKSGH